MPHEMSALLSCQVRYQSEADLTEELQRSTFAEADRQLSSTDIISLYLRRQRIAFLTGEERHCSVLPPRANTDFSSSRALDESAPTVVLLLGDDGAGANGRPATEEGKRCLAAMLRGRQQQSGDDLSEAFELQEEDGACPSTLADQQRDRLIVLAPSCEEGDRALCRELLQWCDVVVGCYDESNADSFRALVERWLPLRRQAVTRLQTETRAAAERHHDHGHLFVNGWLSSERSEVPPLLLVGLRHSRAAGAAETVPRRVSRAQVESLAERENAARLVEVYAGHEGHAAILCRHCTMVRAGTLEDYPLSARDSFLSAKAAALRLLLRAPPPRVVDQRLSEDNQSTLLRCLPSPKATAPPRRLRLWRKGPLEKDSLITEEPITAPLGGGSVTLYCTGRCLFPSDALSVPLPTRSEVPAGYFDAATRCFVLDTASGASDAAALRYCLVADGGGDAKTELWAAPRGSGRVPLLREVDGESEAPWRPWPAQAYDAVAVAPHTLTVTSLPSGFSSTFAVPPVLPTPRIALDAADGTVHIRPFPPPLHIEIRYTVDGTRPSMASPLYQGPFPLALVHRDARAVRAAAFPKVFFASQEAILDLDDDTATNSFVADRSTAITTTNAAPAHRLLSAGTVAIEAMAAPHERHRSSPATTKAQRLRQAFHRGVYAPPHVPFLAGKREDPQELEEPEVERAARGRRGDWSMSAKALRSRGFSSRSASAGGEPFAYTDANEVGLASRTITLPPFDPPLGLTRVIFEQTTVEGAAKASTRATHPIFYCLEGWHPHGSKYTTLAWGELARTTDAQSVFLPEDMSRFPVHALRCVLRCRDKQQLGNVVGVRPCGAPITS